MKRAIALLLSLLFLLPAAACGRAAEESAPLRIVVSVFPAYDWLRQLLGEDPAGVELTLLLDGGVDLHSYQPAADDIVRIAECDMFVYVGGESDAWVADVLAAAAGGSRRDVSLMELMGGALRREELREGMQAGEDEDDAFDEHVWLSVRNASILCRALADELAALDPDHAALYGDRLAAYQAALDELDARYMAAAAAGAYDTLLFGDRFPFLYLTEDYGLDYYAAFSGCSAETEASFETVLFLAEKLDELGLPAILRLESSDGALAETIRQSTRTRDQAILAMDSMQSTTAQDAADGATYLGIMEGNLAVLRQALAAS